LATSFTAVLREQLMALGEDPANFAAEFDRWKARGDDGEFDHYLFGKDGAYARPPVGGIHYTLRHVHLAPLSNPLARQDWDVAWRRRSRKTSDRALVYVTDSVHGHLLVAILDEPGAHDVAAMQTPEDAKIMRQLAMVAEQFINFGKIIA